MAKPRYKGSFIGDKEFGTGNDSGITYEWHGDDWYPATEGRLATPPAVTQAPTGARAAERWVESLTGETDRGVETSAPPPSPTPGDVLLDQLLQEFSNIGRIDQIARGQVRWEPLLDKSPEFGEDAEGKKIRLRPEGLLDTGQLVALRDAIRNRGGLESALRAHGGFDVNTWRSQFPGDILFGDPTPSPPSGFSAFGGGDIQPGGQFDIGSDFKDLRYGGGGGKGGGGGGGEGGGGPEPFGGEAVPMDVVNPFAAYLRGLGQLYGEGYGPGGRGFGMDRLGGSGAPYGMGAYYYPAIFEQLENLGDIDVLDPTELGKIAGGGDLLGVGARGLRTLSDYMARMGAEGGNPLRATRLKAAERLADLAGGNVPGLLRPFVTGGPRYTTGPEGVAPGWESMQQSDAVTGALGSLARSALANRLGGFAYNWLSPMLPGADQLSEQYYAGTGGMGGEFMGAQNLADYMRRSYGLGAPTARYVPEQVAPDDRRVDWMEDDYMTGLV